MKKNYRINTYHIKPFLVSFGKLRKENGKQKRSIIILETDTLEFSQLYFQTTETDYQKRLYVSTGMT